MCTVIVSRQPGAPWPLLLAANRDERLDRPWDPPGAHWPAHPGVIGGRDSTAGGSWMAVNAAGVVVTVLNRPGSLGPAAGKRSRGELPLLALEAPTAEAAATLLCILDAGQWRPFNAVVADADSAWFVAGLGQGHATATALPPGLHMVTAHPPNDPASPRTARHLPRFASAPRPEPPDWDAWPALLADSQGEAGEMLNIPPLDGFGTLCTSLLALGPTGARHWLFAPGPPDRTAFAEVKPAAARVAQ
jgi:hypothetical protein